MAYVLQSEYFKGSERLQNTANYDPQHVIVGEHGDHVRRIHKALVKLGYMQANDPDCLSGQYLENTAKAVGRYKTDKNILNYANRIDEIVGIKTIRSLDEQLTKKPEDPGKRDTPKPDTPVVAVTDDRLVQLVTVEYVVKNPKDDPNPLTVLLEGFFKNHLTDPFETQGTKESTRTNRAFDSRFIRKTVRIAKIAREQAGNPSDPPGYSVFELERTYDITYGLGAPGEKVEVKVSPTRQVTRKWGAADLDRGRTFTADQPLNYREVK